MNPSPEIVLSLYTNQTQGAEMAGLSYTDTDSFTQGITRIKKGKGFSYRWLDGTTIRDKNLIKRLKSLAIPPAWHDVWINPDPQGHILATGFDEKNRKQYRYHSRWQSFRHRLNYYRLIPFGHSLDQLRLNLKKHLSLPRPSKTKVLASAAALLDTTNIRVGNHYYAHANHSYGLTTLKDSHVSVHNSHIVLEFTAKSGKDQKVEAHHPRLAAIIHDLLDRFPGRAIFEYKDETGSIQSITADAVNQYLISQVDVPISAKDFRTWAGTLAAYRYAKNSSNGELKLKDLYQHVGDTLGNTPGMARDHYIHADLLNAIKSASLTKLEQRLQFQYSYRQLEPDENILLELIEALYQSRSDQIFTDGAA